MLEPKPFIERNTNHLYYLEHLHNESFFVRSNLDAPNFKILKSNSFDDNDISNLQTIVSHDESIFISDILYTNKGSEKPSVNVILFLAGDEEMRKEWEDQLDDYTDFFRGKYRIIRGLDEISEARSSSNTQN